MLIKKGGLDKQKESVRKERIEVNKKDGVIKMRNLGIYPPRIDIYPIN